MKKLISALLTLTMMLSLGVTALAATGYDTTVSVNGAALSTSGVPASTASDAPLPLRWVAEADYGFADWYADEGQSFFSMSGNKIYVDCKTGEITLNGKAVQGMKAHFVKGVTFVPAELINQMTGCKAAVKDKTITVTTPNNDDLVKLARDIIAKAGMAANAQYTSAQMEEYTGIRAENFTQVAGFFPMMISADTVVIGKVADGKLDQTKTDLEAYRANTQKSFEQYLPGPLERAKNGQVAVSGSYVMLIISGDNDTAIQLFQDGVKNLK